MKRLALMMAIVLLLAMMPVYAADGDIVSIASSDTSFSTLVAALKKAELVSALQGAGPFTVFAPTDQAFAKLLSELGISAEELLAHPQLSQVLLYHVVSGKVMSTDLKNGMTAATLQGENIAVDLTSGVKINQSAVTKADISATNGVIHVIDTVLVPKSFVLETKAAPDKSIVDIALGSDDFSMLVSLLQKANLVETLQGEGPFTVFAPTNAAFEKLLKALNISAAELMAQPELAKVLLYHVVPGKVMSSDLSQGLEAATAQGEKVVVDLKDGVKINSSKVIAADVEATNGVVHVIDEVLVPQGFSLQEVQMAEAMPKTGVPGMLPVILMGIVGAAGLLWSRKN